MKTKMTNNKGFTTGDIVIGIIIIIIFVSIITNSFYNYYISVESKKRKTMATNVVIDVIENVESMNYSEVNQKSVDELIKKLIEEKTISSAYAVIATLNNYNEMPNNEDKLDLIKILNVKVKYLVNKKEEVFEVTRLIKNEGEIT